MSTTDDFRTVYAELIVRNAGSTDPRLIEAFAAVKREDFVGPGPWQIATAAGYFQTVSDDPSLLYQDILVGLAPERNINNGQPSLHARCLSAVSPARGESVVHIGAGTGYYTAVLARLVGERGTVLGLELEPDLAERARQALAGLPNVRILAESAARCALPKCDVIYVNAGVTHPLAAWLDALNVGGRLLFPLTPDAGSGVMLLVTRRDEATYGAKAFGTVAFIPCIGVRDDAASASLSEALAKGGAAEIRSLRRGSMPDESAWCVGDGWWLSTT